MLHLVFISLHSDLVSAHVLRNDEESPKNLVKQNKHCQSHYLIFPLEETKKRDQMITLFCI